ncbi:MAG TPA: hypothetical protein VEL76_16315 [Gemmataceae bacterium]|nr:hypothetical protein [Gemmataceae bacterium]
MTTRLPLALCLSFTLTATVAGQGSWQEVAWKEGKCTLLLPAAPTIVKNRLQLVHGDGIYTVHYVDRPKLPETKEEKERDEKSKQQETERTLDKTRDDLVASLKGKLLREQKIMLGSIPGRELEIEVPVLGIYRVRMYQAGSRFYQLLLVGPRAVTSSRDAERFFASFRVTK